MSRKLDHIEALSVVIRISKIFQKFFQCREKMVSEAVKFFYSSHENKVTRYK